MKPIVTSVHRREALHLHRGTVSGETADGWIADGNYRLELAEQERIAEYLAARDEEQDLAILAAEQRAARAERERLLNIPHTADFIEAVKLEATHQVERWGSEHDDGKAPADWFWLLGFLAGKALAAAVKGDIEKAKHHAISSAAVLLNWHRRLSGNDTGMRPGIKEPKS